MGFPVIDPPWLVGRGLLQVSKIVSLLITDVAHVYGAQTSILLCTAFPAPF